MVAGEGGDEGVDLVADEVELLAVGSDGVGAAETEAFFEVVVGGFDVFAQSVEAVVVGIGWGDDPQCPVGVDGFAGFGGVVGDGEGTSGEGVWGGCASWW